MLLTLPYTYSLRRRGIFGNVRKLGNLWRVGFNKIDIFTMADNDSKETLRLRLFGGDVRLESLKPTDVADLLTAFENSLRHIIENEKGYQQSDKGKVFVSLVEVENGSANFKFRCMRHAVPRIWMAFSLLTSSIADGTFEKIPPESLKAVKKMKEIASKGNYNIQLEGANCSATITAKTEIPTPPTREGRNHCVWSGTISGGSASAC